jgi:hypothetical protein
LQTGSIKAGARKLFVGIYVIVENTPSLLQRVFSALPDLVGN